MSWEDPNSDPMQDIRDHKNKLVMEGSNLSPEEWMQHYDSLSDKGKLSVVKAVIQSQRIATNCFIFHPRHEEWSITDWTCGHCNRRVPDAHRHHDFS